MLHHFSVGVIYLSYSLENLRTLCYIVKRRKDDNMYYELGTTGIIMYDLLNAVAFFAVLINNFSAFKEKKKMLSNTSLFCIKIFSKKHPGHILSKNGFWSTVEIIVFSVLQYIPAAFLNRKLGVILNTSSNYFGLIWFIPFIMFLLYYIVSINPFRQMDIITPAYPLALFFVKLGCFCNGCCGGFECSWGLMNYYDESKPIREFPAQLVEAALALAIFIFLLWYKKRAKEGTMFPVYLILYSATRFFSEFTRNDPNIFGLLKTYHILCIVGIIIGIVELILVHKYSQKIIPYFERQVFSWYKKDKKIIHHKKR